MRVIFGAAVLAAVAFGCPSANAVTYQFSGTAGTDTVDGTAAFSLSGDVLTVVLTNLLQPSQWNAGDLFGGVDFTLAGATGSGALALTSSGFTADVSNGTYTPSANASSLQKWISTETGTNVALTALSGSQPNELIIGPDNTGGTSGSGTYNVNGSLKNSHEPVTLGSATFDITIPGSYSLSNLSNVVLLFGTGPTAEDGICIDCSGGGTQVVTPLPAALPLLASGIGVFGLLCWRRKRKAAPSVA